MIAMGIVLVAAFVTFKVFIATAKMFFRLTVVGALVLVGVAAYFLTAT